MISRLGRTSFSLLLAISLLSIPATHRTFAQETSTSASGAASPEKSGGDAQSGGDSNDQFRHAGAVKAIAGVLHVSTETAAQIFEDLNSGILIFLILFFLLRALPKAFRTRTANIQKQLVEAQAATEEANARLKAVEDRLSHLDEEISAIRQQAELDSAADEIRIKQSIEDERKRIVASAEQEIASAGAAAQRQLKRFAAELAIDRATQGLRLSAETDRAIVRAFAQDLAAAGKGGRN